MLIVFRDRIRARKRCNSKLCFLLPTSLAKFTLCVKLTLYIYIYVIFLLLYYLVLCLKYIDIGQHFCAVKILQIKIAFTFKLNRYCLSSVISKSSKVGDLSPGWPKGSLFDSYYTKVYGGATPFPGLIYFTLDPYLIMLSVNQGGIKYDFLLVFGMTRPGIEPRSPGPLANTLLIRPSTIFIGKS